MAEKIEITALLDAHDIEFRECDVCDRVFVRGGYYYLAGNIACSVECRDKHITKHFEAEYTAHQLNGIEHKFACERVWSDLVIPEDDSYYYTELEQ